jgi:hypothetical protein
MGRKEEAESRRQDQSVVFKDRLEEVKREQGTRKRSSNGQVQPVI